MPSVDVYVPISNSILVLVEKMKECLEIQFLIQTTQQDIIENAIVFLSTTSKRNKKNRLNLILMDHL